ncbi:MAG: NAD-dependent dihydropyrimidine dehydrogenase subunit PreA [Candidatus Sericytochromatia bacterium]|nr:NAD-dependent dihydropyrimidine dehydrogenase subunit PreA [Candidatus Tanganyikabacteria bacterium]
MADLSVNFAGITAPNPFWLASAPPTNTGAQIMRAYDHGWGGAVWKTLGTPIRNVSARFAANDWGGQKMMGLNNIELITDRPLDVNYREIEEVTRKYPDRATIVSLMFETEDEWKENIERSIEAGAKGLELNFGCPHGMCERGMGSAVGQEPKILERITNWVMRTSTIPVIVKLTPNISEIVPPAMAAQHGGAHAVSLINTIKSLMAVDLDTMIPVPNVGGASTNGGYCGPAVKPIALRMVGELARHEEFNLPISGIGGISTWRDAAEFIALGCTSVQVCTAVMHHGFRIVEDMADGLSRFMDEKGYRTIEDFAGLASRNFRPWEDLNLNFKVVAQINADKCIGCQLCFVACRDGSHHCIYLPGDGTGKAPDDGGRVPHVAADECTGCNLCSLVCPVESCIEMVEIDRGLPEVSWKQFTSGQATLPEYVWKH